MSYMFAVIGLSNTITTFTITGMENWNTSKVTNMSYMFSYEYGGIVFNPGMTSYNIGDLSGWDTSNVTDMSGMFASAGKNATTFSIGDISKWDTSSVTNMYSMFDEAGENANYTLDLSGWNVCNVTVFNDFNLSVDDKVKAPEFGVSCPT